MKARPVRSLTAPLLWGLVGAVALLPLVGCGPSTLEDTGKRLPATPFTLPSLDGDEIALESFAGKLVVLDFWATWCGPCQIQAEILEAVHEEYADQVAFLAVDLEEDIETVRRYVDDKPFPYPVILDERGTVGADFKVRALPTLIVVDRQGQVMFSRMGITDADTLRGLLDKELAADSVAAGG